MKKKLSPKKVKLCPGCPPKDLALELEPQFNFILGKTESTKKITVIGNTKKNKDTKIKSLF